jgi:hypothetical protein
MAEILEEHLRSVNVYFDREKEFPKGRGPLKTYVLEAHKPDGDSLDRRGAAELLGEASQGVGLQLQPTNDKALFQATKGQIGFFFDLLDPRFWVVHTMSNIDECEGVLDKLTDAYPHFDYAWPPSELMRSIQKTGRSAGFAVDFDETTFLPAAESQLIDEPNAIIKFRFGGHSRGDLAHGAREVCTRGPRPFHG